MKRIKCAEEQTSDESETDSDESDNDSYVDEEEHGFEKMVQKTYDKYKDLYQEKLDEFMAIMNQKEAEKKLYDILMPKYKKSLIKDYKSFLEIMYLIKDSPIHHEIKDAINEYAQEAGDDYDYNEIVNRAFKNKKHLFDTILDMFNADSDDSETETESDNDE
jgi:hypothetical protein